jgi:glycosyltransferase involved in cell wall biosynthesis
MPPISAVLITYNEEIDLPRALASMAGVADEFVVVDSGSADRTCEVARQAGARVVQRAFDHYDQQKNFAASQASHDWVLALDADEELSPELRASLLAWKQQEPQEIAYRVATRSNYLGGWIKHSGWYPEYRIRFYRRDRAKWAGAIHESVRAEGPVGKLYGDLLHYTMATVAEHYAKMEGYTNRAAEDLYARGRKRWHGGMWAAAPWTLLQRFFLQLGFLDGYRGAIIAWTSARYVWMKYRKLGVLVRGGKLEQRACPQVTGAGCTGSAPEETSGRSTAREKKDT